MSFLDRLLGRRPEPAPAPTADPDQVAVERYRYLLRTAPPDKLEEAHREAFERLTPEQRAIVRADLTAAAPGDAPASDDPRDLARSATRAELRQPGTLERTFQNQGTMPGMAGSFMSTFAAIFLATSAANLLFGGFGYGDPSAGGEGGDQGAEGDAEGDAGGDAGADAGADTGGWDAGGDAGGFGALGGGDFGGGDFGDF